MVEDIANVFVGRQREMAELRAALDDALTGHGRMVMLAGEPGIGKTRTAQELAALAEQRGAQVLWGRCYEEDGAPPYWPWVQPLRAYIQQAGAEQLTAEMGTGAAVIAENVAEIRGKLPCLEIPPALEPEAARFRLFDSITTFLKNVAERQPLMLVLDDLQWADRSSLLLLEFLAREIGVSSLLLVGAYRDIEVSRRHPLSQSLGALVREQLFHRVQLDGLNQQEVGELVEGNAGVSLTLEAVEVVHTRTNGNPFFVGEIARQVTLENVTEDQWASIIPEGVRDAIGRRLNRLSEQCNDMLTTASVIGREFEHRLLISLMGDTAEDHLVAAMDEALGSHMIEEVPQTVGLYQFTHALIQETLSEELSTTRSASLHVRIAVAMEELYGDDAEVHAAELAHHFAEAQTSTGITKLVRYSLLAGERALASYAYEDALAHFERGLVARDIALSGTETASDEEAASLLFGLARTQSATGAGHQLEEAFTTLSRAFEYYAEAGNADLAVAAAEYPIFIRGTEMGDLIERALPMVPPDSHEAGRLLSRYGGILGRTDGRYDSAQEAFGRALTIVRRAGDEILEMRTLAEAAGVAYTHLRHEESLQWSLSTIELARRIGDPRSEVAAHFYAVGANYTGGNLEEAVRHATEVLPVAEKLRDQWLPGALWRNEIVFHLAGDWRTAREFNDRGLAIAGQSRALLCTRVLMEYELGEFGQGEVYLNRLLEAMDLFPSPDNQYAFCTAVLSLVARVTGDARWIGVAAKAAQSVVAGAPLPLYNISARAALGLVAAMRCEADSAGEQYQFLQRYRGTVLPAILRSVDRLLGILSQTMGVLDQASVHFEDALAFCRRAGYRPELAWSCCDYADALRERDGESDRAKAMSLLDESLAISSELGMRPLMERVLSRREILKA